MPTSPKRPRAFGRKPLSIAGRSARLSGRPCSAMISRSRGRYGSPRSRARRAVQLCGFCERMRVSHVSIHGWSTHMSA
jgi:hypothetical protein